MRYFANFIVYLYPNMRYPMERKLNRIKVVLVEKNISQTELAENLGKSFSTVNAYCCNRQQPSLEVLSEIADYLSVSIKDLVVDKVEVNNDKA